MGIIVNTLSIIVGTLIGVLFNKYISEKYRNIIMQLMGIVSIYMGISSIYGEFESLESVKLIFIFIVSGAIIGRIINLDGRVDKISERFGGEGPLQGIILGFVLFCVGALSIVGPIKSSLQGDNSLLYLNSILSGVTSIILSINYGFFIVVVSIILFFWQGSIYIIAGALSSVMTPEVISQLSFIGGILILASGINILKLGRIKTLNLLPTLLFPILISFFHIT